MQTLNDIIKKLYTMHFDTLREHPQTIIIEDGCEDFTFNAHINIINSHKSLLTITDLRQGHILLEIQVNASILPNVEYTYRISYVDWNFSHTKTFPNDITITIRKYEAE